ncbi:uncharacterized protein [Mytilus edulis]|uniref:uncharacterized protein n=1 Tax=Mytilus edulis TaxID=6550 RepID=UPI0039EDFFCE
MSNSSNSFKKLLNRLNLENVVWESTNFTTQTGTCIDLCVTNRKNIIKSVTVLTPICSSHSPVSVEISFKTFKQHSFKRQIRDFKRADYEGLKNQLNDTDWDDVVFNSNNINDVYMNFVKTFESTVNRYIPTKTITVRPNDKPFMNNLIRNKIRHRNRIHHKAKTSNNPYLWKKFREIRNEITSLERKAKDDYKCKLTSQLIDKDISPANIDIEPEIPDNNEPPPCHLNKFVITEKEILDQLKILNVNKPAGPDGISPRILKEVAGFISKPLTKLFNMSLSVKQVPLLWKIAHVNPIFKGKGSPHSALNYRPISVTSIVCKIMAASLTDDLDVISNWAKSWAVQFNSKKTKNIVFTRREREHPPVFFGINGEEVEKINIHCHFEITFQSSRTRILILFIKKHALVASSSQTLIR